MKLVFLILINCSLLFAGNLIIKDNPVTISINGDRYTLNKDDMQSFIDGSTICYEEGNGRVIIDDTIQLTSNKNNCIQTKIKDNHAFNKLVSSLKNSFLVSFANVEEKVLDGVSSKDVNLTNNIESIWLNLKQDYIVVSSESSGPLPITANIKDQESKIIKSFINETDTNTNFIINIKDLKKAKEIIIFNGFGIIIKTIIINKKD